jgi:hypothetical protein
MTYWVLLNNVFEALNLHFIIFYTYVAEIKLIVAFGSSQHRILLLLFLAIGDFHHIM